MSTTHCARFFSLSDHSFLYQIHSKTAPFLPVTKPPFVSMERIHGTWRILLIPLYTTPPTYATHDL